MNINLNILSAVSEFINSGLAVHMTLHVIFGLPFAYLVWVKTKNKKLVILLLATTVLIDLDHLVDYFSFFGPNFNLMYFFKAKYFDYNGHAYVPVHGWEWSILLVAVGYKKNKWNSILLVLGLALLSHLILDSIHIGDFLIYSFFYRAAHGFKHSPV